MPRPKIGRGGKRVGAGRPPVNPEKTIRIHVPYSFFLAYSQWVLKPGNVERFRLALYKLRDMMERENRDNETN